ncbi:MAG: transposase [Acidobacteria bacterium]|nr:transposase [Acidobacteriota bacterium]
MFDRFHIVAKMNKALDEIRSTRRAHEARRARPGLTQVPLSAAPRSKNLGAEQHFASSSAST